VVLELGLVLDSVEEGEREVRRGVSFGGREDVGSPFVAVPGEYMGLELGSGGFTDEDANVEDTAEDVEAVAVRGVWRGSGAAEFGAVRGVAETEEAEEAEEAEEERLVIREEVGAVASREAKREEGWEGGTGPADIPAENLLPVDKFVKALLVRGVIMLVVRGDGIVTDDRCGGVVRETDVAEELGSGAEDVVVEAEEVVEAEVPGVDDIPIKVRFVLVSLERLKRGRAVAGFCGVVGLERLTALFVVMPSCLLATPFDLLKGSNMQIMLEFEVSFDLSS
jgi:hypothetical protein